MPGACHTAVKFTHMVQTPLSRASLLVKLHHNIYRSLFSHKTCLVECSLHSSSLYKVSGFEENTSPKRSDARSFCHASSSIHLLVQTARHIPQSKRLHLSVGTKLTCFQLLCHAPSPSHPSQHPFPPTPFSLCFVKCNMSMWPSTVLSTVAINCAINCATNCDHQLCYHLWPSTVCHQLWPSTVLSNVAINCVPSTVAMNCAIQVVIGIEEVIN